MYLELLGLVLRTFQLLVELTNLPVCEFKFFLSTLDVLQDVVVWLVCALDKTLVKLNFSLGALKLLL